MTDLFFEKEKEIETYDIPKKPSHFDIMNKLMRKQEVSDLDKKYFSGFLFINQLSMNKKFIQYAIMLNSSPLNDEQIFEIAKFLAPNIGYIKFIKKDKEDKDLEIIKWYFKVNTETAKRYKKYLSKEEFKKLKELYKENKDAIN
jgi:hypothetical protein